MCNLVILSYFFSKEYLIHEVPYIYFAFDSNALDNRNDGRMFVSGWFFGYRQHLFVSQIFMLMKEDC